MRKASILSLILFCVVLALSPLSHAATVIMNDNGFLYTDGAFPVSSMGDIFGGVGFISSTNPALNVDLTSNEMTWSLTGLSVSDQFAVGSRYYTNFTGGKILIAVDPMMNADYGIHPPNATVPMTFEDGDIFLKGIVTASYMTYDADRQFGVIVMLVNFTTGMGMEDIGEPNGNIVEYTFGPDDPNIPAGFNLQAIGNIQVPALCTVKGNVSFEYNPETCVKCEGITLLDLLYTGVGDLSSLEITGGVQYEIIGDHLILTPGALDEKLPGNVKITVGLAETDIHTSCSRPITVGNVIDKFTVVQVEKILIPCEEANCNSMNRLRLRYHGLGDPSCAVVSDGAYATWDGEFLSILPSGDELRGNTTITIGTDVATIHTSCSQPLEPGFVFGEYEVVEVGAIFLGAGDDTSPTSGPVVGVTVDLVDGEGSSHSTMTDELGDYVFFDVACDSISVSVIAPLGYYPLTPTEVDVVCGPGEEAIVDFVFERLATQDKPRSTGFWKHQIVSALKGKQKGVQVPADELLSCFEFIHTRFDKYFEIFTPVLTLEDFNSIISLKKPTMFEKARKEFAGLLLNTVSGRLATWQFVSPDQANVSQAITYVSQLLMSDNETNFEMAKYIAETINHDELVDANLIPLDIGYIAYRRGADLPGSIARASNYPNPFNPATTINYDLKTALPVTLAVYNVAGQKIRQLITGEMQNGYNTVQWDGTDDRGNQISSGVYFYRLKAGDEVVTHRMVLLR
ncbi:MAG: T9SS type A sorting domain-containing protein [Bacteroidales bacterium]|nr:T9SS type A sorting domain-containing protein [Candidatus Latescibacterota bacterium]